MRRLALVCISLGVSCRPRSVPVIDAGAGDATVVPTAQSKPALRVARPISALRTPTGAAVVARDRASGGLVLAALEGSSSLPDGAVAATFALPTAAGLDNPEVAGAWPRLGILADAPDDAAKRRVFLRVSIDADGGAHASEPVSVGGATCATADGVYSIARDNDGWKGTFFPFAGEASEGPFLPGRTEATIVCGRARAFLVLAGSGEVRALRWSPSDHDARPTLLPRVPSAEGDDETVMSAAEDDLVLVKRDSAALYTLVWTGQGAASWHKAEMNSPEGRALESIEAEAHWLGMLFLRTVPKAKGCSGSETTDAVLELAVAALDTGKLVHAPEAVETWKCGAEPGPFFTGWTRGKLVAAWPRGADAVCTRAGVKRGGLGFAEVDPAGGRAKVGRIARPAETIAEAGCGESQCYAVALTRGSDPCGASDGPESGRLELVAYPPP